MNKHIQIAAILNIAAGALWLIAGAVIFLCFTLVGGIVASQGNHEAAGIVTIVAIAISGFLVLLGLPSIVAGWGLYSGKSWAKPVMLVLAVLSLIHIPFGTALGIYTLWALLHDAGDIST